MSTAHPSVKKLREAVAEISGKTGVNAATIAAVTEKFVALLSSRFEHICDVALADENEGKVVIGLTVRFDMTHKAPVGTVTLGFSQRTKDEAAFQVEDPEQMNIPFAQAVGQQTRSQGPTASPNRSSANTPPPTSSTNPGSEQSSTPSRATRRRRSTSTPTTNDPPF